MKLIDKIAKIHGDVSIFGGTTECSHEGSDIYVKMMM